MGSSQEEKLCLKWNDFEANISFSFRELSEEKDFSDVTLACEDQQVEAHRVILAASSSFFSRILKRNSHSHPLIYLKGIKFSDLEALLKLIYHGEVNVCESNLKAFLDAGEELKVKGLAQDRKSSNQPRTASPFPTTTPHSAAASFPQVSAPEPSNLQTVATSGGINSTGVRMLTHNNNSDCEMPVKVEKMEAKEENSELPLEELGSHHLDNQLDNQQGGQHHHDDYYSYQGQCSLICPNIS